MGRDPVKNWIETKENPHTKKKSIAWDAPNKSSYWFPEELFTNIRDHSSDTTTLIPALYYAAYHFDHGESLLDTTDRQYNLLKNAKGYKDVGDFIIDEALRREGVTFDEWLDKKTGPLYERFGEHVTNKDQIIIDKLKEGSLDSFREYLKSYVFKDPAYTNKADLDEMQRWFTINYTLPEWAESMGAPEATLQYIRGMNIKTGGIIDDLQQDSYNYKKLMSSALSSHAILKNGKSYMELADSRNKNHQLSDGFGKAVVVSDTGTPYYKIGGILMDKDGNIPREVYTKETDGSILKILNNVEGIPEKYILNTGGPPPAVGDTSISLDDFVANQQGNNPAFTSKAAYEEWLNEFNPYYDDLHSLERGTLGRRMLDNSESLFRKEADNAIQAARTAAQTQALTQAQTLKQITDSVRAERMAQLRAGMSEAQLAEREIQMLMAGGRQLSDSAYQANQAVYEAQLSANTAKEQAFNQYIEQVTPLGQNAAAEHAALVGDLVATATRYMNRQKELGYDMTLEDAIKVVGPYNKQTPENPRN